MNENHHPQRKKPTHGILSIPNQSAIIFDTVCTKNRQPWLADPAVHQLLEQTWKEASAWRVGRYVIMPDHIHFFAGESDSAIPYENWVKYWKSSFSRKFERPDCRWQSDHWECRIRNEAQLEEKWHYVVYNPVRHRLVSRPENWPYRGELFPLRWN